VKDAGAKGSKIVRLRTRGRSFEVLLKQGLKVKALGERGSPWCRGTRPRCSLLLNSMAMTTSSENSIEPRQEGLEGNMLLWQGFTSKP
jgi:hypothetical protein